MVEKKLVHPSCEYCTRQAYHGGHDEHGDMRRYFCFGERDEASPADSGDYHNFCVYTPFKGVIQFHVNSADMEWWMALFLAAWRVMRDRPEIHWPAIEAIADALKVQEV